MASATQSESKPLHVLVSGTTGWIGGELAKTLIASKCRVTGINRRPCEMEGLEALQGDISKPDFALEGVDKLDAAVHLAGTLGWCSIEQAVDANLAGSRRFVQAALDRGCRRIIVASSVACVGTEAPSYPPSKLPMAVDHPYEGGPWPYAFSKYAVESLMDLFAADENNKEVDFIVVRIGATVTNPPHIRHLDGMVDGKQVSWEVPPATCADKPYSTDKPEKFPEAALCSIALSDQIDCLLAAIRAPHSPGVRKVACVAPKVYAEASVPELMASWYGKEAASKIDMSYYNVPGRERDPIYDLEPGRHAIGWEPKVDLLAGKDPSLPKKVDRAPANGPTSNGPTNGPTSKPPATPVHVTIVKRVAEAEQQKWLAMANELSAATWQEDGCENYSFVRSSMAADTFCIVERWASQAHLDAHFLTPHFVKLVPAMDAISETIQLHVSTDAMSVKRPPRTTKILVLYDSSTTCTGQMAALVAEGARQLDHIEVRLRVVPGPDNHWDDANKAVRVHDVPASFADVHWADGVACGSPTNLGCVSWRMKKFWDDMSQAGYWPKLDGRVGCSFSSVGGSGGGAELVCMAMNAIMMNFGFSCFGITDYVSFKTTLHYGAQVAKAPRDPLDQMACRRLGRRLAEFAAFYMSHRDECHPLLASKAHDFAAWGGAAIPGRNADPDQLLKLNTAPFTGPLYLPELAPSGMALLPQTAAPVSLAKDSAGALAILKPGSNKRVALVYTAMCDYVHGSTAAAATYISLQLASRGYEPLVSDDPAQLEMPTAPAFDLIVLVNNSGQIFDPAREALTRHLEQGRPVLGLHACLASFLDGQDASGATPLGATCSVIQDVFGAHFVNHPPPQKGTVALRRPADAKSPWNAKTSLGALPDTYEAFDEFFNYQLADSAFGKAGDVTVLATLDESTYEGGTMGQSHPIVWSREWGDKAARVFYCGLGHFSSDYSSEGPKQHTAAFIRAGMDYVLGGAQ
jgi:NAD(P)H dehydrogenase (quinone)